jgi:hypothetical protein
MLLPLFGDAAPHEIFSLLAYHPRDLDASVLSISTDPDPPTHVVDSNRPPVCATLGDLDTLPIELLDEVLQYSDLRTVSMLRLLNRRARVVVDTSVPYRHILLRAPGVVTALGRTGVASHFSVSEVFYALSTPTCQVWHIPECIPCCFSCLREAPELMPMGEGDARAAFGLTKRGLAKVPIMVTLPGTYTPSKIPYRKRRHLLSREKARQAAIVAHGGEEGLTRYINSGLSQAKIKYDRYMIDGWHGIEPERLLTCRGESISPLTISPGSWQLSLSHTSIPAHAQCMSALRVEDANLNMRGRYHLICTTLWQINVIKHIPRKGFSSILKGAWARRPCGVHVGTHALAANRTTFGLGLEEALANSGENLYGKLRMN